MGTSKSYAGPVGQNPLLPPGAPPPLDGDQDAPHIPELDSLPQWGPVKAAMSRLATSGNHGAAAARGVAAVGSRYIQAQGGARGAARAAMAGRRGAVALGRFLASVATSGVSEAFRAFNISSFAGQPVEALLEALVEALAPAGVGIEEEVARRAMAQTLDDLLERCLDADGAVDLNRLSETLSFEVLVDYLAHYIDERLMQALSDRNEVKSNGASEAVATEEDIRQYIRDTVRFDLDALADAGTTADGIDWSGTQGRAFVDRIFIQAHALLEVEV